ncbi:MAG: hypothetical protein E7260_10260 [Lachnospiraceae bacterium]|nr:hypothetical protein [Lachnospiraceae bacterium]
MGNHRSHCGNVKRSCAFGRRGFAVVASQVKNLSEESAKAAGQTRGLIEATIQAVEKFVI